MPLHDRGAVRAARERPVRAAARVSEPGCAERVRDLRWGVADEERSLEAERGELDHPARAVLELLRVDELLAQPTGRSVEPGVASLGDVDLGEQSVHALGLLRRRAQEVERVDVSGALPQREERALAEEPRERRLLDVAV